LEVNMGLLDDILRGALGGTSGGLGGQLGGSVGRQQPAPGQSGSNLGGIMVALLPVVLGMLAKRGNAAQAGVDQGGGGLGDLIGGMLGGGGAAAGGGAGGLGDLLEHFQRAGLGEQAKSWVGTGQNLPISPDVIGQIFGNDGLSRIAQQAGMNEQEASEGLSQLLPDVVDRLTPDGEVPGLDQLSASVEALTRQFRG
jgi:uncharacterized protein YidB (DUF937 family)